MGNEFNQKEPIKIMSETAVHEPITAENLPKMKEAVAKMTMAELVAFYNQYEKTVKKFDSIEKGVFNVRALLERLSIQPDYKHESKKTASAGTSPDATEAPKKRGRQAMSDEEKAAKVAAAAEAKAALKAEQAADREAKKAKKEAEKAERAAKKASPSFRYEPNLTKPVHAVRAGSMVSKMIDLIARPQGATIAELEAVSFDTSHSVKSLLNYDMRSQVGYGYYSEDGMTVHILYPEGMKAPLEHFVKPAPVAKEPKAPKPPKEAKAPKAAKVAKGEVAAQPTA